MGLEVELSAGTRKGIRFIDRPLRKGEKTNYQCNDCGAYISHDSIYSHRCNINTRDTLGRGI